jgi:transcriptional regulator of acetoin/glycerol metabolism
MEVLNLEHHHKLMCVKALNKNNTIMKASEELGITDRCLYRWMKKFNIKKVNRIYEIKNN